MCDDKPFFRGRVAVAVAPQFVIFSNKTPFVKKSNNVPVNPYIEFFLKNMRPFKMQ